MLDTTHLFCQEELAGDRMCHPVGRRRLARLVASKEKAESPFAGGNNLAAAPAAAERGGKGVVRPSLPPSLAHSVMNGSPSFQPPSTFLFLPSYLCMETINMFAVVLVA